MARIDVLDWNRQVSKSIDVPDAIFAQPVKQHLLHEVVKWQLAKRRQGTHKVKSRGEVSRRRQKAPQAKRVWKCTSRFYPIPV